ncbi:MAG: DUF2934 domain-containing protein [Formivibrio sp.]|nr:DUF2934 domain-containing protein [Formivibrio sp.]
MATSTPAAPKKVTRKAPASKPVKKEEVAATIEPTEPAKKRTKKTVKPNLITSEERHHLVEVAAYYLAERRGFGSGSLHDDWLQAEQQIDQMIASGKFKV